MNERSSSSFHPVFFPSYVYFEVFVSVIILFSVFSSLNRYTYSLRTGSIIPMTPETCTNDLFSKLPTEPKRPYK